MNFPSALEEKWSILSKAVHCILEKTVWEKKLLVSLFPQYAEKPVDSCLPVIFVYCMHCFASFLIY